MEKQISPIGKNDFPNWGEHQANVRLAKTLQ